MLVSLLSMHPATAEIDAMQQALQQPYLKKLAFEWENIAAGQLWLKGVEPKYYTQWNTHVIRLNAGQQSSFYLPANQRLRLYHPEKELPVNAIAVYKSNGTGLLAKVAMQSSPDGRVLINVQQSAKVQIVHLINVARKTGSIALVVQVSRPQQLKNIAPYRNVKVLSGKWAWLNKNPLQIPALHSQLQAYQKKFVDLEGPTRIAIKNRLSYEAQASELIQDYRIRYRLNDKSPVWLDFSTAVESQYRMRINTVMKTLGRQQQAFIEVPSGHHRLELMSDRNLYLQVLQQSEHDYLFAQLNQPPLSVQTVRKQGLMAQQKLPELNALAQHMARDNKVKSSALLGRDLLRQHALGQTDSAPALAEANKLLAQRTFYRDLQPSIKHAPGEQFNAYFINKTIKAVRKKQADAVLSAQHLGAALKRLGHSNFHPIASNPGKDSYVLPVRSSTTLLRIITDKRKCRQQLIKIQFDQNPPASFMLHCADDSGSAQDQLQSLSETALLELQKQPGTPANTTLSHLFSAYRKPAALIPVAINEINLPRQVKRIQVWSDSSDYPALNLALQIRAAKPFQFSEQSYRSRLHWLSKEHLFKIFVADLQSAQGQTNQTEQQLLNEWLPLKRLLRSRYRQYKTSVAKQMPGVERVNKKHNEVWQANALRAEQDQQWVEALTYWNNIVEASQSMQRDQAQLSQAAILDRLSENYLAQSLWRYLSLYAQADIAEQAGNQLLKIYRQQNNSTAMQMLAAAMFIKRLDQQSLNVLIEVLMQDQQYRYALLLGMTAINPPTEMLLKAAYHLEWWQTYEQLLIQLPTSQQGFWIGLKAQKQGHFQVALDVWEKSQVNDWLLHLQQGLAIRKKLSKPGKVIQIYDEWSQWQLQHPGGKVIQDASRFVKDAAGTDQFYALERDIYSQAFRGTSHRPVKLQVMGPVNLTFNVRVLHAKPESQLDGWLRIDDNRESFIYPFSNNRPVPGMVLTGAGDFLPGNLFTLQYQVGQGPHEIELFSEAAAVAVNISEQLPELPLTVLAPLQLNTFTQALPAAYITENQLKKLIVVQPSTSMAIAKKGLTLQSILAMPEVTDASQAEKPNNQMLGSDGKR